MAVRQYIGARYVTKIYENSLDSSSAEWEASVTYEPLTLVTYNYSSYLSKKEVPATVGNPAANPAYWVVTGAYNGQIATLQAEIDAINALLIRSYPTTSELAAADLSAGDYAQTLGYYSENDGGDGFYTISVTPGTINVPLSNGLYANLDYGETLHVKQAGAVGDGVTDDLAAFTAALSAAKDVVVDSGTYALSDDITISRYQTLRGVSEVVTATDPELKFTSGGVVIPNSNCTVKNLAIRTTSSDIGVNIDASVNGSVEFVTVENLYIKDASIGLSADGGSVWMLKLDSIRCNDCAKGMYFNGVHPCAIITNCYMHKCKPSILDINGSRLSFDSCNFGYYDTGKIVIQGGSLVTFKNCNFECDEHISTNTMISVSSDSVTFKDCAFVLNQAAASTVISIYSGGKAILFETCNVSYNAAHDSSAEFFNSAQVHGHQYGNIVIGKGCYGIKRLTTPGTSIRAYFLDLDNSNVPHIYNVSSLDSAKLNSGEIFYSDKNGLLCYYNGTNVVDMQGNTIT